MGPHLRCFDDELPARLGGWVLVSGCFAGAGDLTTVRRRESGAEFFTGRLGTPRVPSDETSRQGQAREQTVKVEPTTQAERSGVVTRVGGPA